MMVMEEDKVWLLNPKTRPLEKEPSPESLSLLSLLFES
ncbi:unnamed protein product [Spirodela intermedia]|uniref:Uncharacterized protein n=2 Tax=Spirodela intermedia TaxID=51605 RepID=A0ABN7E8Z0_SPIIN|nr:unnamed protein product [Spirodela intermedia]CAA6665379.1 unnamed protein product [Spirodela intermedia]CAA6674170.1 unnamed protein product [Spirodela intermedia]CAA7402110.1 unnamed protein product [Spirodela intermedia]